MNIDTDVETQKGHRHTQRDTKMHRHTHTRTQSESGREMRDQPSPHATYLLGMFFHLRQGKESKSIKCHLPTQPTDDNFH